MYMCWLVLAFSSHFERLLSAHLFVRVVFVLVESCFLPATLFCFLLSPFDLLSLHLIDGTWQNFFSLDSGSDHTLQSVHFSLYSCGCLLA